MILTPTGLQETHQSWLLQYLGSCVSGFVPTSSGTNQIVLGVPFLRAWHTQYSYDPTTQAAKVGIAAPATVSSPSASSSQSSSIAFAGRKLAGQSAGHVKGDKTGGAVFGASIPSARQRGLH